MLLRTVNHLIGMKYYDPCLFYVIVLSNDQQTGATINKKNLLKANIFHRPYTNLKFCFCVLFT